MPRSTTPSAAPSTNAQVPSSRAALLFAAFVLSCATAHAQVSVTATAGTTGPTAYTNLRLAFAAVNAGTHQGDILMDITSSPSTDNNTAVLNASGSGSASYTSVLVQPSGSTGARTISGTINGAPLIDLNGADNVTIDGRTGDGYTLTLSNQSAATTTATSTIRFQNDATNNTIVRCKVLGRSTGTTAVLSGNIIFAGTSGSTGNDGNTIDDCDIGNDGTSTTNLMSKAIVSVGSTGSLALHNSGNVVRDCRILNFFITGGSRGVLLGAGNHAWGITGNKFYQEAARTSTTANSEHFVIDVASGSSNSAGGHAIEGNTIGFANASGTGTWTLDGGNTHRFRAISFHAAMAGPRSSIGGNTIANIAHASTATGTNANSPCVMVRVDNGRVDVHGNTIGSQTGTGSITYTPSAVERHFHAVLNVSSTDWSVKHNLIGSITVGSNSSALYGIRSLAVTGTLESDSNTVGGVTTNSMHTTGASAHASIHGIALAGGTVTATGNLVRNLRAEGHNSAAATANGITVAGGTLHSTGNTVRKVHSGNRNVRGFALSGATVTMTGDSILELSSGASNKPDAVAHGVSAVNTVLTVSGCRISGVGIGNIEAAGIFATGGSVQVHGSAISGIDCWGIWGGTLACGIRVVDAPLTATGNTIANVTGTGRVPEGGSAGIVVANTAGAHAVVLRGNTVHTMGTGTGDTEATGIRAALSGSGNTIERNLVHSLRLSTGSVSTATFIRGIHLVSGTGTVRNNMVRLGINEAGAAITSPWQTYGIHVAGGAFSVLHNSVYIGGAGVTGTARNTFALLSDVTGTRDYRNNILWNARSGTGSHYAIGVHSNLTGLTSDHNCLRVSGTGGVLGREGATDRANLAAWQSATGKDANSVSTNPHFLNPTGNAANVDLHIDHITVGAAALSRGGMDGTGVFEDFDGAARTQPPDIGADQLPWGAMLGDLCMAPMHPDDTTMAGSGPYFSRNGYEVAPHDTIRILVILMELDYSNDTIPDPMPNGSDEWPVGQLPTWVDNPDPTQNLFDPVLPQDGIAKGQVTRYYQQASSGKFIVLGDYLLDTISGHNGVFRKPSQPRGEVLSSGIVLNHVNSVMMGSLATYYGHNSLGDFDKWTLGGPVGLPKDRAADGRYDHVAVFLRNSHAPGNRTGRHPGTGSLFGNQISTMTVNGGHSGIPTDVFRHEFGHNLYGGNNFHSAGGGWGAPTHYWMHMSGGWSNMGLGSSSLNCWNAWDRRRMGWADDSLGIAAHNAANDTLVNGDLDPANPAHAGEYVLRDFVLTGDALRIRLPHMDPARYPEFIWVENHQGRANNGCLYDAWIYEGNPCCCAEDLVPGLFMYLQIDRDVLDTTSSGVLFGGHADHIRPLSASGHHDVSWHGPDQGCMTAPHSFIRSQPNPLTGFGDTHFVPHDNNANGALVGNEFRLQNLEHVPSGPAYLHHNFNLGHPRHAFTPTGNRKLGVGTNPSSASHISRAGSQNGGDYPSNTQPDSKNVRAVHLNGISVELIEQRQDSSIKVRVRFDDVDVANDARWCGDSIVLSPVPTLSGHSLNITGGHTLTLDQGLSHTRRNNPITFGGQPVFASPTLLRCTDQSWLNVDTNSVLVVDHGSTLRIEAGARVDVAHGGLLRVKRGGKIEIMGGGTLNVADSAKVLIEEGTDLADDGRLLFHAGARINVEGTVGEVEIAGQLHIGAGATFQLSQAADATLTTGRLRFSNSRTPSTNVTAGAGSAFVVRGDHKQRRVLLVEQESLYGPPELVEFSLLTASAELADGARIVPPVTNACAINFIDARVTSPSAPNTHRGLRLNGQPFVTLRGSTFQRGAYGLFSNSALLGAAPYLNNCLFEECGTGLYAFGLGVEADSTGFSQCGTGLLGEQLSQTSFLNGCGATYNQTGLSLQGNTTVRITDPFLNQNQRGLVLDGMDARVECGSVSHNSIAGFHVRNGALLRMDSTVAGPHDPVWAVENTITILCDLAENSYLNMGRNNLRPQAPGTQKALLGTFICQPYAFEQPAYRNNWDGTVGTALTSAEYDITSCGGNLVFTDPHSSDTTACGQAVPPCPEPPCEEEDLPDGFSEPPTWDAFTDCPGCRDVTTTTLGTVPLNQAALDAKLMGDDDGETDNEKQAIERWVEILMHPLDSLGAEESYLAEYGLALMLESYSDAFAKGQLLRDAADGETGDYLALVDSVLSKRIAESSADSLYHRRLFASVDKAQAYRMAGRLGTAVTLMNGVLGWVENDEEELITRIACLTTLERDLADSTLHWDEVEDALALCATSLAIADKPEKGQPAHRSVTTAPKVTICTPGIHPNPTLDGALIEGFPEEQTMVRITDLGGQEVWRVSVNGKEVLPAGLLHPGLYLYSMTTTSGAFCTGKLVVAK